MTSFFHGGHPGLNPGQLVRPAISVGKARRRTAHQPHYNPHRVYVTTRRAYAALFAQAGGGWLYLVRPVGRTSPDPDARGSFHCGSAEVLRVLTAGPMPLPGLPVRRPVRNSR